MFGPDLLQGKAAFVTGGGTGIGLAAAKMFYELGANVIIVGRREEVLQQAAYHLDPTGARVLDVVCDIRDPGMVESAVAVAREQFGSIRILVNNAGGQFPAPAEAITPNGFEAVVRNNLLGTWNVTREVAIRSMIPHGGGVVVNVIANVARGFPGMVHTGAARAGVENMTRTLAIEWIGHGIRVNAVAPGIIRTEGVSNYPEDLRMRAVRNTPSKRFGTVEEVARSIVYLASDVSSFVNGVTLYVDGGASLWGETWPIPS